MLREACDSLLEAVDAERTDIVMSILDHLTKNSDNTDFVLSDVLSHQVTKSGTLLHHTVSKGLTDSSRALLLSGADPGIKNSENKSVLDLATSPALLQVFTDELLRGVAANNCDRVKQLLDGGVSVSVVDSPATGNTALHWAASFGSKEEVELLLSRSANIDAANAEGVTPLHDAVQRGDVGIVKFMINSGAVQDVPATGGRFAGKSPRDLAMNKPKILEWFNNESADADIVNNGNHSEAVPNIGKTSVVVPQTPTALVHNPLKTQPSPRSTSIIPPLSLPPLVTDSKLSLLWPPPLVLQQLDGPTVTIPPHLHLLVSPSKDHSIHNILDVWEVHRDELHQLGHTASILRADKSGTISAESGQVEVSMSANLSHDGYHLTITSARVRLIAGGPVGLHFGIYSLMQLLWIYRGCSMPQLSIKDKPRLAVRGILIDMALYGRLPTVDTFISLIHTMARLKINEIHLYTRLSPSPDWQLPYSPTCIIALDRECHDRHINLVPALDISQICSFDDLSSYTSIFAKILPCFSHQDSIHLGPCLTTTIMSAMAHLTPDQVISRLPYILSVSCTTTIFLCSNTLQSHPSLLANLPHTIGLIQYGFHAEQPFLPSLTTLSSSGCQQLVCPGTSSWNCLVGRPSNMVANITSAVHAAQSTGSLGVVVADWAGSPAIAHLSTSLPGFALAAGLSWNPDLDEEYVSSYLGEVISHHVLLDCSGNAGKALLDLGRAESCIVSPAPLEAGANSLQTTVLLNLMMRPHSVDLEDVSLEQLGLVIQSVRKCLSILQSCREGGGGLGEGMVQEVCLTGELVLLLCRLARGMITAKVQSVMELQPTFRTDLANKLLSLTEQYRAVWLSRYIPGGLQASLLYLNSLLNLLLPDHMRK